MDFWSPTLRKCGNKWNIAPGSVKETKASKELHGLRSISIFVAFKDKHVFTRMKEQELSDRCRQGDNRARKILYEQYAGRMLGVCLRYAGDRDSAQDLVHDGFLKIFASFDKFAWRGEGSLRAWMERVMVNTALQFLRKNDVMSQTMALDEVPETYDEPEGSEVEAIPQAVLMQFIGELPTGYRTVFNLYTFEDKSHKEIAQLLGINEKSSASQLFRAKNVLAKRVKEWITNNG